MTTTTVLLGFSVDAELKREFEETAGELGVDSTAALATFMERFVADRGCPFDAEVCIPTREQFVEETSSRYERMLAGDETEHDLVEV